MLFLINYRKKTCKMTELYSVCPLVEIIMPLWFVLMLGLFPRQTLAIFWKMWHKWTSIKTIICMMSLLFFFFKITFLITFVLLYLKYLLIKLWSWRAVLVTGCFQTPWLHSTVQGVDAWWNLNGNETSFTEPALPAEVKHLGLS